MESRVEKLEESITNLKTESLLLKNEILNFKFESIGRIIK